MSENDSETLNKIFTAAQSEFMEKGFKSASLRNIVKTAGVTTGAFYGYYSSKEDLFDALVKPTADEFIDKYLKLQQEFSELLPEKQAANMSSSSDFGVDWMVEYIYEHLQQFKLILCASDGTKYSEFIHEVVEIEMDYTFRFIDTLKNAGYTVNEIDKSLCHILSSTLFNALFEFVSHDMPYDKAIDYVHTLRKFYTAGWNKILGL